MYKIIRHYEDDRGTETVDQGYTLSQAQAHCQDPATKGVTEDGVRWFDGYENMTTDTLEGGHEVTIHRTVTTESTVTADDLGNAQVSPSEEVLNYLSSHLVCSECGPLVDDDELLSHGFNVMWEES